MYKHNEKLAKEKLQKAEEYNQDQENQILELMQEHDNLQQQIIELKANVNSAESGKESNIAKDSGMRPTLMQYEQDKMQEKIKDQEAELNKIKEEYNHQKAENSFFHQSTTIFINIKKIMDIQNKQYLRKLELE